MLYTFGEPEKPKNLKFPATVGTKFGGTLKTDCVQFNFSGWTGTATLQYQTDSPVAMTVDIDNTAGTIFFTVPKATAESYAGQTVNFVLQLESGALGFIVAYGTIYFDKHPHL